jgi:transposase-like protein
MLTVLGGLTVCARFDPSAHRRRPGAGRGARAENGPTPKLTPHQKQEAIKRRDTGDETLADIARSYNVSPATISRLPP